MGYAGEAKRQYQREWLANRRAKAVALLGGKCAWCGSADDLQFDHINPRDKDPKITGNGHGFPWHWSWSRIEAELAKCWLLCQECHRVKTRDDRPEALHGSAGMWRRGCRCTECRTYAREDKRRYRTTRTGV